MQIFIVVKEVYWVLSEQVQNPVLARAGTNQGLLKLILLIFPVSLRFSKLSLPLIGCSKTSSILTASLNSKACDQTFSLIFFMSRPCALALSSPSARLLAAFLRLKSSFLAEMSRSVRRRVSADWLTVLGLVVVDSLARRSASRDLL